MPNQQPNQQPNLEQQVNKNKFWQTNLSTDRFIKILGIICLIVLSLTLFIAISTVLLFAGELVILFGSLLCFPLLILIPVYVFLVLLRFKNLKKSDRFLFVVNLVITALVIGIYMIGGYGDIFFGIPVLFLNTFFPIEIELPNSEINLPDETAGWQTYRNEEYGFEFKYPKEWELGEFDSMGILVYDPQKFSKEKCEETGNQCFYAIGGVALQPKSSSELETLVNRLEGKKITVSGEPDRIYNFISKNKLEGRDAYEIEYKADDGGILKDIWAVEEGRNTINLQFEYFGEKEYKDIFDQIVSTFKFIDITADWQTYRNEKYGFEVKYPNTWKEEQPPFAFKGIILNENSKNPNGFDLSMSFFYYDNINEVSWTSKNPPKNFDDYVKDPMFQNAMPIDFLGNRAFMVTFLNETINYSETRIIILHNTHIYEISYDNLDRVDLNKQVISTFKFIK